MWLINVRSFVYVDVILNIVSFTRFIKNITMANSNTKIESDKKFADIDDELIKNKRHETLEETQIKVETDEPKLVINLDGEVRSGDESELVNKSGDGDTADEGRSGNQRENRLTSIIDQLRGANKLKGYTPREGFSGDASNGKSNNLHV